MSTTTNHADADRTIIEAQADEVAALLGLAPEEVMFDKDGLSLTVKQGAQLLHLARAGQGSIERESGRFPDRAARIIAVMTIAYDRSTDLIVPTGHWSTSGYTLNGVRAMLAAGHQHEMYAVLGWGRATHRLQFMEDYPKGGYTPTGQHIGEQFLVEVG